MEKREFKAESKRLLDIVINSIYTNREIFLRELISNASDAIDKVYYKTLGDSSLTFNKDDYYIKIKPNKEKRTLTISDKGIGMTEKELDENLGVIAKSGSLQFKKENEIKDGFDIIGQFGVGFYSGFLVADKITVITKAFGADKAYKWESDGVDGYTISEAEKDSFGTDIILHLKANDEDENYDEFLEEYKLKSLIKKYSDFIRYPIKLDVTKSRVKEGTENEHEEYVEEETVNSMVPLWRRNKNELTDDDYNNFYVEKRFGFDKPLRHMHISVDGMISYNSILYIPENIPYDYYTKEYEKGLELYSNGVLIMEKCSELLPDYFGFVKGIVDSQDLSLNISREMLQHDRQLSRIAKNIKTKIKNELESMMKNDRESYEKFYKSFGRQLKYGVYDDFGMNKDELKDLLMFYSSKEKKMVSLAEYVERMAEDQKYIYYAVGESNERIEKMPQTEMVLDKGYEILYFTEDVDEFAIKMLMNYKEKEFKSVSSGDLGIESEEENKKENEENKGIFEAMKEALGEKISAVKASSRLKNYPVCLSSEGEVSIEMEKILSAMPNNQGVKAQKVLEVNTNHEVFNSLKDALENDKDKFNLYTKLLYNQALLVEGLSIEDPVDFTNDICKLMK
ncbi:molecular chaperone HtpG [Clostridium perfringens]|uniref:Chaperone protein HtpG n=1 Tax=Clostridium perfringens D str. JGS1721 TaxID=488537 RepID=B1V0T3_CLOPF|nr:molecular chaperone HtpG [Clostridium perfringens]EDT72639.1 heat shock protein [Clostridium perfringens D str. JGS1721]EIF2087169.1 molecular chaperone HtpG [Clostridium perfringens]EJT6499022.1 molecular chaperone HtpG [Clostridium perfringens]ELC8342021.1 molecular chaperone HtpG [Clostridium perfringens]ELC8370483.1 molecular chaperone HtpG [Clostridium perfringens]